ncbi:MAG TPA: hypothetical protein VFV22_01190 [Candidatus Paceibacterota bacterium]|nr:hypothetical protein [Candidatus Paceibacterota bacterium]
MGLINKWHDMLNMPKYDEAWHKQDMTDELAEYEGAIGFIDTWSEISDVVYTYTRAKWSGHNMIDFPLSKILLPIGILYMIPKYTLRWKFFRDIGHQFDKNLNISEVRNPKKIEKLKVIAEKYNLDPKEFTNKALTLMKGRIFLK